jgi:hypothetical protein
MAQFPALLNNQEFFKMVLRVSICPHWLSSKYPDPVNVILENSCPIAVFTHY